MRLVHQKKFVSFKVSSIKFGLPWLLRPLKVLLLGEDAMQIFVTAVAGHGASGLLHKVHKYLHAINYWQGAVFKM